MKDAETIWVESKSKHASAPLFLVDLFHNVLRESTNINFD